VQLVQNGSCPSVRLRTRNDRNEQLYYRRWIEKYELNWRLIIACQLLGESQVGGSIIGFMLDLTAVAFRNNWTPMELQLGVEQVQIGKRIVLRKETLGKVAFLCDGIVKYQFIDSTERHLVTRLASAPPRNSFIHFGSPQRPINPMHY
jgi:hypothetical protein